MPIYEVGIALLNSYNFVVMADNEDDAEVLAVELAKAGKIKLSLSECEYSNIVPSNKKMSQILHLWTKDGLLE